MTEKPQSEQTVTADSSPEPERCDPAGSYIPSTGTLQRPVAVLGTFGAGLNTKVEFGGLDAKKAFQADDKVTARDPDPTSVSATRIDIIVDVTSEASGGGRYVRVTQGKKVGVSSKEIFTLVKVEE